jgi:hypothetical protein
VDAAGNRGVGVRLVNVSDTQPPMMLLQGDVIFSVVVNDTYEVDGYSDFLVLHDAPFLLFYCRSCLCPFVNLSMP